jgi:hypothetical protein
MKYAIYAISDKGILVYNNAMLVLSIHVCQGQKVATKPLKPIPRMAGLEEMLIFYYIRPKHTC